MTYIVLPLINSCYNNPRVLQVGGGGSVYNTDLFL